VKQKLISFGTHGQGSRNEAAGESKVKPPFVLIESGNLKAETLPGEASLLEYGTDSTGQGLHGPRPVK
jgi:hypothetical protein